MKNEKWISFTLNKSMKQNNFRNDFSVLSIKFHVLKNEMISLGLITSPRPLLCVKNKKIRDFKIPTIRL